MSVEAPDPPTLVAPERAAAPADRGGQADHDDEVADEATASPGDHPRTLWRVRWAWPGRRRRGHVYVDQRDARAAVARLEAEGAAVELHRTDVAVSWVDPVPGDIGPPLERYPRCVMPDSVAADICRALASGWTLDQIADAGDYSGVPAWMRHAGEHHVATLVLDLHEIGVTTPGVTAAEADAIVNAPRATCGVPAKSTGRPCRRTVPFPGMHCPAHDRRGRDDP